MGLSSPSDCQIIVRTQLQNGNPHKNQSKDCWPWLAWIDLAFWLNAVNRFAVAAQAREPWGLMNKIMGAVETSSAEVDSQLPDQNLLLIHGFIFYLQDFVPKRDIKSIYVAILLKGFHIEIQVGNEPLGSSILTRHVL